MRKLKHSVKFYIPHHDDSNVTYDVVQNTAKWLADRLGGATIQAGNSGLWRGEDGAFVRDAVTIVEAFGDFPTGFTHATVPLFAEYIRLTLDQDAVSVVVDGVMYIFERGEFDLSVETRGRPLTTSEMVERGNEIHEVLLGKEDVRDALLKAMCNPPHSTGFKGGRKPLNGGDLQWAQAAAKGAGFSFAPRPALGDDDPYPILASPQTSREFDLSKDRYTSWGDACWAASIGPYAP